MSKKHFSFQECFNDLNGQLYRIALRNGLSKENAEDVVQDTWINVYKRLEQDKKLRHRFETEPKYSNNYIFRSTINGIINKRKQWKKNTDEPKEEDTKIEFKDSVETNQRNETVQKFLKELKKVLKDDENQFLDLYQEVAEQNISINISDVARLMGVKATKGHDIFRRIKRKAQAFEAKNEMLKDVAAPAAIFDFGIFDFFKDIFRPRFILDKKYQQAGERISNKVLSELGIDAISTFSKFVK